MSFFRRNRAAPAVVSSKVIDVNEADFDGIVRKNDLAIVMFCKPECPHCIQMEPIYQQLSEEMVDRVLFCRVNTLSNAKLIKEYGVSRTPTFVLIKHGSVVRSMAGEYPKYILKDEITSQL